MNSPQDLQDHESLSALFDGELQGDAARFAHKRLGQDVRWRQSCGDWQLAGDVLRGRATAPAPRGFAERVQRELAREVRESAAVGASPAPRRGWMGGAALAASVAVAAWFVANPFEDAASLATPQTPAVVAAVPPALATPATPLFVPAAVASAESPQGDQAVAGGRSGGQAGPAPRAPVRDRVALASVPATEVVPEATAVAGGSIDATALADPFRLPPAVAAGPRPWPRAVLPGPVGHALTAGYGRPPQNLEIDFGAAAGPGFYPFEPRLTPDAERATLPAQGDP